MKETVSMKSIALRTHKNLRKPDGFQIIKLDQSFANAHMIEKLHRHDYYFILAIKRGTGKHQIDFIDYGIKNCSLFLLKPGQVHQVELKQGCSGYIITFDKQFYYPFQESKIHLFRKLFQHNQFLLTNNQFNSLFQLIKSIYTEYSNRSLGFAEAVASYFDLIFLNLFRTNPKLVQQSSSNKHQLFDQFSLLVEQNIKTHKSATFFANKLNVSTHKLNSISKSILGKTSTQIITDWVILEAKRNLLATSLQVNEIAINLGFEDESYFTRFFKKHTNNTPGAFRKQH